MTEYIDKQAASSLPVLPKEHREYQTFNIDDAYESGWDDALECVEKIPAAAVRPVVRGRWEIQSCGMGGEDVFCSVCKCGSNMPYWPFCPMCGADMRGEADGN